MFERLPRQIAGVVRRARWFASDRAWTANWRAIRAAATPWAREQYEAARAKLAAGHAAAKRTNVVIEALVEGA